MSSSPALKLTNLVFLRRMIGDKTQLCLAQKKRGFGAGKWDGVGGKALPDESVEAAAVREVKEEIGVEVSIEDLKYSATLTYTYETNPEWNQEMHVYFVDYWQGEPKDSDEMFPQWYFLDEIPYSSMWEDMRVWLPRILLGEKLEARFDFDKNQKVVNSNIIPMNLQDFILDNNH